MDAKTILMGIGLLAAVIVVIKFSKQILMLAIILAVIVVVAGLAWVLFQIADLDGETLGDAAALARVLRPEPEREPVTTTPVWIYACGGSVATLALLAVVAAGGFWLRWRLERSGRGLTLPRETRPARDDRYPILVIDGDAGMGWDEWGG
jgi:FtsH-binding integral membrane protein